MSRSESGSENRPPAGNRLAAAIQRVREDQANRDDVVVEMRNAARVRLELLAQDLGALFAELPGDADQFEFSLTKGEMPRLWIDMTAFVRMGRDRRTYEFVKDTRLGRTLLSATSDREKAAERVTAYVAERILERERMIEGDWIAAGPAGQAQPAASPRHAAASSSLAAALLAFLLGLLLGAIGMVAWAWFS